MVKELNLLISQQIQRFLFSSVKDDFDCVLQIYAHFVWIQIFLWFLAESFFCLGIFTFQWEDRLYVRYVSWKATHFSRFGCRFILGFRFCQCSWRSRYRFLLIAWAQMIRTLGIIKLAFWFISCSGVGSIILCGLWHISFLFIFSKNIWLNYLLTIIKFE